MKRAPPSSYVDREPHSIRISHPSNPTHPTPLPIQNDSSTPSKPAPPPASCRPSCPGINPTNSGISRPGRRANPSFGDKQAASQSAAALLKPALSQSAARVLPRKLYFPDKQAAAVRSLPHGSVNRPASIKSEASSSSSSCVRRSILRTRAMFRLEATGLSPAPPTCSSVSRPR